MESNSQVEWLQDYEDDNGDYLPGDPNALENRNTEPKKVRTDIIAAATRDILRAIGADIDDPELRDTPRRVADFWKEFVEYEDDKLETSFESVQADQMVVVSGIRVWSLCAHHLLPFWCDIAIGYIARDSILGLSKFARISHQCAHRLQVQEGLVRQIADKIQAVTKSPDVAVIAHGEHTCSVARGIRTPNIMTSSAMMGVFRERLEVRAELMALIDQAERRRK